LSLESSQKKFPFKGGAEEDVLLVCLPITYLFFFSFLALIYVLEFEKECICFLNFNLGLLFSIICKTKNPNYFSQNKAQIQRQDILPTL
jgi:hypothetical protein